MASQLLRETLTQLMDDLDLTREDVAGALGTTIRNIDRWYKGETFPQKEGRKQFDRLLAFRDRIQECFPLGRQVRQWMHTDNTSLGFIKPVEALKAGRLDRVEAALEAEAGGVFV